MTNETHDLRLRTWREVLIVATTAVVTVAAADAALQQLTPVLPERIEVIDGVTAYEAGDPDLLVLGSSHSRGFSAIADALADARPGYETVLMAVERGKLTSYEWVLQHRLRPLIEERGDDGALVRDDLERVLLVTEWWDSCAPDQVPDTNVPGRAWTLDDFVSDVTEHGLNEYNTNFIDYHWRRLWASSILVQDRGVQRVPDDLIGIALPRSEASREANHEARIGWWREMVEGGYETCYDESELAAAGRIIEYFQDRGVEVALVLFPRMPSTITQRARETTLARYAEIIGQLAARRDVRVVDLSTSTPLTDDHFMNDFDHTTPEGNQLLADWGLAGPLSFLLEPPGGSTR